LHGLRSLHGCHVAAGVVKWIGFNSLRLLYSATRDGFSSREFHTRVSWSLLIVTKSHCGIGLNKFLLASVKFIENFF
jgi:hypothetical protein